MGRSRGGLTAKIHALSMPRVDRSIFCSLPGRRAMRRRGGSCWPVSHRAVSFSPTRPTTPTPSAPRRRSAAPLPTCRPASSTSAPSPSAPGSTARETKSSASSIASSRCEASQRATTAARTTSWQPLSSPQLASGSMRNESAA